MGVVASMAKGKSGSATARLVRWRSWVQAAFLLVWLNPMARLHTVCSPVFHCHSCPWALFVCPIGMLANFSAVGVFPFLVIGTLVAVGAVFGSFVCGWACPFGFLQDLIARVPTPKFELPAWMGLTRYAVLLVFVLAVPFLYGEHHPLFFCSLCPAGALEAAVPYAVRQATEAGEIAWPSAAKTTILGLILAAMFFKRRPWCTVFCPLGAIYGLFNRVSIFFVRFQPQRCTDCELCHGRCPCVGRSERRAGPERCVRCLECVQCNALSLGSVFGRPDDHEVPCNTPPS